MKGRPRTSAAWVIGFAVASVAAGTGVAHAQPAPTDPVIPQIPGVVTNLVTAPGPLPVNPPPPPGAPTVPAIPADQLQAPGELGSIGNVLSNPGEVIGTLFADPVAPYTPVRQMPMGPPPPPDPAFAPRQ
ncbi:hypothetical protein MycrhN_4991 [Mycolicibacterium rhodesiae NBB3]|uniref:Uncharacterized protein n=1 Tax=Mycolicibacterium rhodesiae (strain NBB3) TaxID=710685 RepID=G8RUR8_MYCRN|nr:hypothetical protein [Mycolicibacterium rhodesiae]AEV75471.1 hypothetical protein MycrhN_4991 [Mycolicibacterium rhodesiae NBB3]